MLDIPRDTDTNYIREVRNIFQEHDYLCWSPYKRYVRLETEDLHCPKCKIRIMKKPVARAQHIMFNYDIEAHRKDSKILMIRVITDDIPHHLGLELEEIAKDNMSQNHTQRLVFIRHYGKKYTIRAYSPDKGWGAFKEPHDLEDTLATIGAIPHARDTLSGQRNLLDYKNKEDWS